MPDKLIATDEVARILDVKIRTVQLWIRQKKLPGIKLGSRTWRVREKDLEKFIEDRAAATDAD